VEQWGEPQMGRVEGIVWARKSTRQVTRRPDAGVIKVQLDWVAGTPQCGQDSRGPS
jgi:hypothetical protein